MATLTIGTASGGYYNFRGANSTPYAMGSSVVIQNTGGDINTTGGYEGIICSQLTFQASGYTTTSSLYGNIWNSSGASETASAAVSAATDTTAPFGSKTFDLSDQYFATPQTIYVGYSRAAASPTAWDVVNGDNTTRVGNTAGSAPSGLTGTGTGTIYRRLVGTLTYTLYDAGTITRSVTLPTTLKPAVAFGGINGTHAKTITVDWGDGSADQTASIAALRNFSATALTITKTADYSPGTFPVTTKISYSSVAVGIPDITFSNTVSTVPGAPTALSATAASSTSISLSWTAPVYANGLSASGGTNGTVTYALYRGATVVPGASALTDTTFTDTGLDPATLYSYTVKATNTTGQGPASTAGTATTSSAIPSAVDSSTYAISTFSTGLSSTFSATLYVSATANGSAITDYQYSLDNTNWTSLGLPNAYGQVTVSGLTKTTYYTVYVRAVNALGNSSSVITTWTSYDPITGDQYNTTSFTHGGRYKRYVSTESYGTEWAPLYMKKYNGTAWVDAPIQIYNGTVWGYTDA